MFNPALFLKSRNKKILIIALITILSLSVVFGSFFIIEETNYSFLKKSGVKEKTKNIISQSAKLEPQPLEEEISLIFGGDIMLSRQVNNKMEKYNDYAWPFAEIASTTSAADLTIANLESPFLIGAPSYQVLTGSFSFKANPASVIGLQKAGIDLVSLANNHILNQGRSGLEDTKKS